MPYVLALDQGTTSSLTLFFDRTGRVRGGAQRDFARQAAVSRAKSRP